MKDERQRKKEEAARELEERRKSLAQRPSAPLILHPSNIRIGIESSPSVVELPPRSHTADSVQRSMYAHSNSNIHIGLPATPKAMRLISESEKDKNNIPVPPIPSTFAQRHSPVGSSKQRSPKKEREAGPLAFLPSSVYQPPARGIMTRSLSAPSIPPPVATSPKIPSSHSKGHSSDPSRRRGNSEDIRTVDDMIRARQASQESNNYGILPPPPPPPPPMLKELRHLAVPPPPPPVPLPYSSHYNTGMFGSGLIEVVMDDDDPVSATFATPIDTAAPVLSSPVSPISKGHSRGRSFTERDNGFAGRLSKATDRFRSGSRTRKETSSRSRGPDDNGYAPYESVLMPANHIRDGQRSPPAMLAKPQKAVPTGLRRKEMI
ncbi:IDC1 protein [Colletotrichum higginsianum]|nr:IDC1 protein [Colletotrichum higginsianum]